MFNKLSQKSVKRLFVLMVFLLITLSVIVLAIVVNNNSSIENSSAAVNDPTIHNLNVLAVGYDPGGSDGRTIADKYYKYLYGGLTVQQQEDKVFNDIINSFKSLSENKINYTIAKKLDIHEFRSYPDGFKFDVDSFSQCINNSPNENLTACEQRKSQFDYVAMFTDNHLCELVDQYNIDEIWFLSPPYIMAWESNMIGPTPGFWINGPTYVVPSCKKQIVLLNGTYDRPETVLHSDGHRIEATLEYLSRDWSAADKTKFITQFHDLTRKTAASSSHSPYCGNVHFPGNAEQEYQYDNKNSFQSNCADWNNLPIYTNTTQSINCNAWGCTDPGWQRYWFGSIPSKEGYVSITNKSGNPMLLRKDFWYYILYPQNSIDFPNNPAETLLSPQPNPSPFPQPDPQLPVPQPSPNPEPSPQPIINPASVECGYVDVNSDNQLTIIDFASFAKVYGKTCSDVAPVTGCKGKDIDQDGEIDIIDFAAFALKYNKPSCLN